MYKLICQLTIFLSMSLFLHTLQATHASFSDHYKQLKYEASLAYTKYSAGDSWWNKIAPLNLYLGALPLENQGHLQAIVDLGVTHVLSMVEDFEIEDGWFNKPVKQKKWKEHGIEVKHIQAVDFLPLSQEQLGEGIEYLARTLEQGHSVYVHCKAGRGRSASVVVGFLMKHNHLSFDDAFALVKDQRPQINLNKQQQDAILSYFAQDGSTANPAQQERISGGIYHLFHNMNDLSEESLSKLLDDLLYYVIEGMEYDSMHMAPAALSTWMPTIDIASTLQRRNRYLREFTGDQEAATQAAIARNHGLTRRLKIMVVGAVPFIGAPTSHSISLWHQLREIALIAAIHGHDIHDQEVRMKILSCLVGGDMMKIPALSVKHIAKVIAKSILPDLVPGAVVTIPARMIFDYFTDNAAYVATHAKAMFAGEHSIPVDEKIYAEGFSP